MYLIKNQIISQIISSIETDIHIDSSGEYWTGYFTDWTEIKSDAKMTIIWRAIIRRHLLCIMKILASLKIISNCFKGSFSTAYGLSSNGLSLRSIVFDLTGCQMLGASIGKTGRQLITWTGDLQPQTGERIALWSVL